MNARKIVCSLTCLLCLIPIACKSSQYTQASVKKVPTKKIILDKEDTNLGIPSSWQNEPQQQKHGEVIILDDLEKLWYAGKYETARTAFVNLNEKIRNDSYLEWALWRGRLFTQYWSGQDLGLASENISELYVSQDDIWVGTWTGGLLRLSEPLNQKKVWDVGGPSLAVRTVNRILFEKPYIWVLRYAQLERYDTQSSLWTTRKDLPVTERLQDILFYQGKLYLATLGYGLWVNEFSSWKKLHTPGQFVTRMEKGVDNQILVGTMNSGIYIYDTQQESWMRPPVKEGMSANITAIQMHGSVLAFGTFGAGAYLWNAESGDVLYFGKKELGDYWVLDIIFSNSRWYFATFGAGLVSWEPESNEWDRIGLADGLPSVDITTLNVSQNGDLWAGMLNGGIVRIHRDIHG